MNRKTCSASRPIPCRRWSTTIPHEQPRSSEDGSPMAEAISSKPIKLSDVEKSAVVLLSIGEGAAAQVMKHMTQLEINLLSLAMARISHVSKTEVTTVFQEFVDLMLEEIPISIGGESYVRDVLAQ